MPTYNRLVRNTETGEVTSRLLEESIESFLRQDYRDKLLLILADTPGQMFSVKQSTPVCPIHVLSFPERFKSLGEKCNYGLKVIQEAIAGPAYVTRWDDDDISLPNRLSTAVKQIGDADLLVVQGWFYEPEQGKLIPDIGPIGFAQDLVDLDLARITGYEATGSPDEDQRFRKALLTRSAKHRVFQPGIDELNYIYRWGSTASAHFSGTSGSDAFVKFEAKPILTGEYVIKPRWHRDYVAYADAARAKYKQEKQNANLGEGSR